VKRFVALSQSTDHTILMKNFTVIAIFLGMLALPVIAQARMADDGVSALSNDFGTNLPELRIAQTGGMSLSEAIESVRRRGNVERIISAETRVSGGRETHHIKVLTKDGKVQTHKVAGRKLG
jgi:hypothetical protein